MLDNATESLSIITYETSVSSEQEITKARAFVKLFIHVENGVEKGTFHFKYSELHQLYEKHLRGVRLTELDSRRKFL